MDIPPPGIQMQQQQQPLLNQPGMNQPPGYTSGPIIQQPGQQPMDANWMPFRLKSQIVLVVWNI